MNPEFDRLQSAADFSGEQASKEFRSAITASLVFGATAFLAHEALEHALPEGPFRDASSDTVLALGCIAAGVTAAAGSITAAFWRIDEIRYLRAERKVSINTSEHQ